jgi:NADH dehydrogenase (ubiquinone) 1 beta subcomplex subunit 8
MLSTVAYRATRYIAVRTQPLSMLRLTGEERQIGDYPEVPWSSAQLRDPYATYNLDQQERRNTNEPVHEQDEVLGMWIFDNDPYISKEKALVWFLGAFGILGVFGLLIAASKPERFRLAVPRELPYAYRTKLERKTPTE